MTVWCAFCYGEWPSIPAAEATGHVFFPAMGCPMKSGIPCSSCHRMKGGDCLYCGGDEGCTACSYTGMCPTCYGTGDSKPLLQHKLEWEETKARMSKEFGIRSKPPIRTVPKGKQ